MQPDGVATMIDGAPLPLGPDGEIFLEGFAQRRHEAGAAGGGLLPGGDAPEDLLGDAPRLFRRDPPVTSDDEAPVGGLAPAIAGAVVDDVGADAGGLYANTESGQPVIPCDERRFGRREGLDGTLVEGELEVCGSFAHPC